MLKTLNKIKIAAISFGAIGIAGGTGVGIYFAFQKKENVPNDFNAVIFNDILFASKDQLLDYIKNNAEEVEKSSGQDIFTVEKGNDKYSFDTYESAFRYASQYLKTSEIYLKPGTTLDEELFTISPESFVKKEDTIKYLVFAKFAGSNEKHKYVTVRANASSEEIEKARDEAATSYIQMHSGFKFNGIYFNTVNDVRSYIEANWKNIANFDQDKVGGLKALFLEDGRMITFDGVASEEDLRNNDNFRKQILEHITPYYSFGERFLEVAQHNINSIKNVIDETDLPYIIINSNDDEITQIVDMDNSTPNGNIYGPYYVRSGIGMDGVSDNANWNNVPEDTPLPQLGEMVDISILKSSINYLVKTRGFSSVLDFIYVTKIPSNNLTMAEYVTTQFAQGEYYLQKMVNLIQNLGKGVRNNHLDNIIALHDFTINMLIQNHENSNKIIEIAKYFDSMMQILDSLLTTFLAPFLMEDDQGKGILPQNFHINYFQSAFSFYNDKAKGKGIDFQSNPYSYYRKLVGHESDEGGSERQVIFRLVQAAMGIHGISMNALTQNQGIYQNWAKNYQNLLEYNQNIGLSSTLNQEELTFANEPDDNQMWDFSFSTPSQATEEEENAIWNNLGLINQQISFGSQVISPLTIWDNANNYLQTIQNAYIKDYRENILSEVKEITSMYTPSKQEITNPQTGETTEYIKEARVYTREDESFFALNTISFIDIEKSDIFDGHVTTANKFNHLENMIKSAIAPLEERIMNFATQVGTIAAQVAIAAATAGVGSEATLMEKGFASSKVGITNKVTAITDDFIVSTKRSTSYELSYSWIRETRVKTSGDSFTKKLKKDVDWSVLGSESKENNAIEAFGDFYGSFYDFGSSQLSNIMKDIAIVQLRIISNVIPIIGQIFSIINNFATSERQIYSFSQAEDGTTLYWDGGLVNYSWWGLKADQKYSINDLEMIEPQEIISGYTSSEAGLYYGNETHDSLDILKYTQAEKIVQKTLNLDRMLIDDQEYMVEQGLKNIYWSIQIKDINNLNFTDNYYQSIDQLINYVITFGTSDIPKAVYKTATGLITADPSEIQRDLIETTVNKLKNILILRLPDFENGIPSSTEKFILPVPYFQGGKLVTDDDGNQDKYIVFDPNIDMENLLISLDEINLKDSAIRKNITDALESISAQDYESSSKTINTLIKPYIKNIFVPQKEVIFQELNDQKNIYFEDFDNSWTKSLKTIYYFKNNEGRRLYFTNKKAALVELLSPDNYYLDISTLGRATKVYIFDDLVYNSINKIYEYIISHGKEVE